MLEKEKLTALRMRRQCLSAPADKEEYDRLYRDTSPVQNVYFHGFGQPFGLVRIERIRVAVRNIAERAPTGTNVSHNQESSSFIVKALSEIWAAGLLTNCRQNVRSE